MACPICESSAVINENRRTADGRVGTHVLCERCGEYVASWEAAHDLPGIVRSEPSKKQILAHALWKMRRGGQVPFLTTHNVDEILRNYPPSLIDQANNFVIWLAETVLPGHSMATNGRRHLYIVGAATPGGFGLILEHLQKENFIECNPHTDLRERAEAEATLTFKGWSRYEELKRGAAQSTKAFMAMQFGDVELDEIVSRFWRPAVHQTGFDLVRLDDAPRAGLIDDRLRVEIRTSRFVIADVSHRNPGAYWEAAYAEGLGKPVIYTCDRERFDDAHFDTNHHLTVLWDRNDLASAADLLKATIRATLPDEAKLIDS